MARWDEILTLPVQNPPTLEFSAADITWSRVEGWRETMDRLALIPFSRVNDFVRGESNNKECPTRFHVEARRRRPPEMAYKPKVDGILEYILYWCSFGPDDHRKGGIVRPSRNYAAKRKTPAGRPNTKRGCVCHFIVKRLIAEPSVALIIYNQDKHIDKKGLPCHGPMDKKAVGTKAMFAPYISDELRLQIMSLLYVGVPVETIMQRHTETVEKQGGPCNRDDLLTHRYVRRLERKIRRSTYELDSDDAVSIGMWIEDHRNHIFFYEDFSDSDPFVLGIQTEWQLQQMIRFGNRRLLASDSRFGTNKLKYPIYSLLVFDSNNNAIPVAWIITPNFANGETHKWMGALYDRVRSKDPTWQLGGLIIDDPSADMLTVREVFQCSVLISYWRVRHAWHKNLMERCSEQELRVVMFRRLGEAISNICRGNGDMDLFEAFLEDFVDCSDFSDYFKAVWLPRIGAWIAALKALPVASSEVSTAIECYHHQLKLRLLNEKDSSVYQRADWLIDKLGTKVHSYYWLDEYSGKANFVRYWKDEWKSGLTAWQQALQVPDSDVALELEGKCAKVVNQKNGEKIHTVSNPGSEFAICDCDWSKLGNLCKHVIKSTRIYRDKGLATSSTSLFGYNRTLMSILHCPPNDSVIRDHAIALSVCIRTQLNTLLDPQNGSATSTITIPREQQTPNDVRVSDPDKFENAVEDSINEHQSVSDKRDEVFGNENLSITEKDSNAVENINDKGTDAVMQSDDTSLTGLLPADQLLFNNNATASDHVENESENLLDKSNDLLDASTGAATVREECADQRSDDALRNSVRKKTMDIDPCSATDVLEAEDNDAMIIDSVGINSGICDSAHMESSHVLDCHGITTESINLDHDNVTMDNGISDTMANGVTGCFTTGTAFADSSFPAVDGVTGAVISDSGASNPDTQEVAALVKLNVSEIDLRTCSVVPKACVLGPDDANKNVSIDQMMDFAPDEVNAGAMEMVDGERMLSSTVTVNGF